VSLALVGCAESLKAKVQHEIEVNPDLKQHNLVVKVVEEREGYVTLSVAGVDWGFGPGWDAKRSVENGESFSTQLAYWGNAHGRTLGALERVLAGLPGLKQVKWKIIE
jgi:hypothetical protein